MRWCVLWFALVGCNGPDEDTDVEDTYRPDTNDYGCDDGVNWDIRGNEAPVVGDEWEVYLLCGDVLMQGAYVVRFTPADFAMVDGNIITFVKSGTAEFFAQVGSFRETREVTVVE